MRSASVCYNLCGCYPKGFPQHPQGTQKKEDQKEKHYDDGFLSILTPQSGSYKVEQGSLANAQGDPCGTRIGGLCRKTSRLLRLLNLKFQA